MQYIDVDSGAIKTSHHAVFDKAWYLQPIRPPIAQLLYNMGMEQEEQFVMAPPLQPRPPALWPPTPSETPPPPPSKAKQSSIPLRLTEAPIIHPTVAAATKTINPYYNTALDLHLAINRLNIIDHGIG
jgi:hypothetical protein